MESTSGSLYLWEQWIKERVENGLIVNEWWLKNEVSRHTYCYWYQKVRGNKEWTANEEIIFADITSSL